MIAAEGLESWTAERIAAHRGAIAAALRNCGLVESELSSAVARTSNALLNVIGSSRARWILRHYAEAQSELALTSRVGGDLRHIIIDRTFVDDEGVRWIVDFKTSSHEGGKLDTFLDNEVARYREQLGQYAGAVSAIDSRPIRLGLYFPVLDAWCEWEWRASASTAASKS
jgi:hypothetical protein